MIPLTFGFLLHDTARLMRRDFERRSRSSGLTRAQWAVLAYLARSEGTSQAALAETLEIEPITLVRLLDRLENAGWVERRADPSDRRVRRLYLTETARPLMEQFQELAAATREAALLGLDEAERRQLTDLLMKVRTNLSGRDIAVAMAAGETTERSRQNLKVPHDA
ncbi:MAG TPA: MarR family transcriptional regulator [Dongiaceae bacterium]|jgi:DNA-binding MarR family transcriptional regulator|nr:MarR family transcriptional regulator [Dongiaceae bacterium]